MNIPSDKDRIILWWPCHPSRAFKNVPYLHIMVSENRIGTQNNVRYSRYTKCDASHQMITLLFQLVTSLLVTGEVSHWWVKLVTSLVHTVGFGFIDNEWSQYKQWCIPKWRHCLTMTIHCQWTQIQPCSAVLRGCFVQYCIWLLMRSIYSMVLLVWGAIWQNIYSGES